MKRIIAIPRKNALKGKLKRKKITEKSNRNNATIII